MLWIRLPSRSNTSTVLWSSAVRNRRFPLRSTAKWSKSPEKFGKGVVATNFNGSFSCALVVSAKAKNRNNNIPSDFFTLYLLGRILDQNIANSPYCKGHEKL